MAGADEAIVYESAFDEQTVEEAAADAEGGAMEGDGSVRPRFVSESSGTEVTAADLEVSVGGAASAGSRRDEHEKPLYFYQGTCDCATAGYVCVI